MISCFISAELETKVDGVLTIEPSVPCFHMFDRGGDVIVVGYVQLHRINGSADPAVTEMVYRLLALLDVSRAENVCVGRIALASDFNDREAKTLVGSRD